tara:strand:- start:717 stop:1133 length:417 start_codon:yes stop_codon:yes gene_type:complete
MRIDDAILSGSILGSSAVVSISGSFSGSFAGDGSRLTNLPPYNYSPTIQTTNFTAISGRAYIISSSSSPVTMSLPLTPQNGDSIKLANMDGRPTLVARNGSKIMSDAEDMTLDIVASSFELMYESTLIGWTIIGSRSI